MKKLVTLLAVGAVMGAQAILVPGDWVNIDYGDNNGVAVGGTDLGAAGDTGAWNNYTSGWQNPATSGYVKGSGDGIVVGGWSDNGNGGGAGEWNWGTDALRQDYCWLGSGSLNTNLNGTVVDSFRRMTVFGDDVVAGTTWNITMMGQGNAEGQGMNIIMNNNGSYEVLKASGANYTDTSWEEGRNYVTFNDITLENGEVEFWMFTDATDTTSAISGIQMQMVPEPATFGLLVIFGGVMAFFRRKFTI